MNCFKNETIQKITKKDLQKEKGNVIIIFAARKVNNSLCKDVILKVEKS